MSDNGLTHLNTVRLPSLGHDGDGIS